MKATPPILFVILLWLAACARQSSPSGGPKDEDPPKVVAAYPPNESLHFDRSEIHVLFNEFIQLHNPSKNIIISPPLEDVKYKAQRKQLTISLPDTLEPNTTYKINFGEAIRDLNEGNVLNNFSYVFATGAVLDSLTFSGTIADAFSSEPVEGVKVCLYPILADSFIYKNPPAYFATSTAAGAYSITNIREDSFYVVAFNDANTNFRYDRNFESIAFVNNPFYVDSHITRVSLRLSTEPTLFPKLSCQNINYTTALLTIDRPKLPKEELHISPPPSFRDSLAPDSTVLYYDTITPFTMTYINYQGDTFVQQCTAGSQGSFRLFQKRWLNERLKLTFTGILDSVYRAPLVTMDTTKTPLVVDTIYQNSLILALPKNAAKLLLPDSAILSKHERFLFSSTISVNQQTNTGKESALILKLKDSSQGTPSKIVQLARGSQTKQRYLRPTTTTLTFPRIAPGTYSVKVILDANHNSSWDPAIFELRQQPEPVITFPEKIEVKPNWEQTIELDLSTE